jgi:hypothetical protein
MGEKQIKEIVRNFVQVITNSGFVRSLILFVKWPLLGSFILKLLASVLQFLNPIILRSLLNSLSAQSTYISIALSFALFLSALVGAMSFQHQYWIGFKYGDNVLLK